MFEVLLLLYFRIVHVNDGISGISLSLLKVARPHVVHPVNEIHLYKAKKAVRITMQRMRKGK